MYLTYIHENIQSYRLLQFRVHVVFTNQCLKQLVFLVSISKYKKNQIISQYLFVLLLLLITISICHSTTEPRPENA